MPTHPPRVLVATLYGGASYSHPDRAERYDSLDTVRAEWDARRRWGRSRDGLGTPCWGDGFYGGDGSDYVALAWWINAADLDSDGWDSTDAYPDRVLVLGPRGGLHWESA